MTFEPIKAGPVFWCDPDSSAMWTAEAPLDTVSLGVSHPCPGCANPGRVVEAIDLGTREYRCVAHSEEHTRQDAWPRVRHAIPERWCEVERGDPPRFVMHLGETVSAVVEMRRHAP